MHELVRLVPRLQSIAVFESAARLGSFTKAADELGMTQPAVSRRIMDLEASVKLSLFDRHPNRVMLSDDGATLFAAVQAGFDEVARCLHELARPEPTFLLAANPGFAQQWLLPHLDLLQAALGDVDLRLRLFDRDNELEDERYDAAIHLTSTANAPDGTRVLFAEEVVPVASADFADSVGLTADSPADALPQLEKLHLDGRDRQWLDWQGWFDSHGVAWSPSTARRRYNNYPLIMHDAIAGRGVALAWRGLVDPMLDSGALVVVGPAVTRAEVAYQMFPGPRGAGATFERVLNWMADLTV